MFINLAIIYKGCVIYLKFIMKETNLKFIYKTMRKNDILTFDWLIEYENIIYDRIENATKNIFKLSKL